MGNDEISEHSEEDEFDHPPFLKRTGLVPLKKQYRPNHDNRLTSRQRTKLKFRIIPPYVKESKKIKLPL